MPKQVYRDQREPIFHEDAQRPDEPRLKGAIVRIIRDKGFGFIRGASDGLEYFFHKSALRGDEEWDALNEAQPVTFVSRPGQKGPRAEDVQLV